ncbi:MAG: hypothetical protein AAB447_04035 [Patescibacteria group bacterium]
MSAVIPIIITIIGIGVILWGIVSCQRQQQAKPSTNPPNTPPPQGGGVWQKMKSGRVLTIVISIALICALAYGCSKMKFAGNSGVVGAIPPPPKSEIHLTAYPDRLVEAAVWEKFGSKVDYEIVRRGNVWAYPDRKTNSVLLTPLNMKTRVGAEWMISFRSAESGPVEVVLRVK